MGVKQTLTEADVLYSYRPGKQILVHLFRSVMNCNLQPDAKSNKDKLNITMKPSQAAEKKHKNGGSPSLIFHITRNILI